MPLPQATPDIGLTWALQASLAAGVAIAGAAVALMFRRPAMRSLAGALISISAATTTIWAALEANNAGWPLWAVVGVLSVSVTLSPVIGYQFYRQLIRLLAGESAVAAPPVAQTTAIAIAGFMAFVVIGMTTADVTSGRPIIIAIIGSVLVFAGLGWLFVAAGQARQRNGGKRWALAILQVSFVLLAARNGINIVVAAVSAATGGEPQFSMTATVAQAFLIVAALSLQLVAVLDEERTHSLQQSEKLRQAELTVAASQRMESLGRMAGAVAHDFNNVLAAISVGAQSALAAPAESQDEALREVEESARRGKALTEQLLAFARAEQSKVTRFDARAQVEKLRSFLERIAGRRNTLQVEPAGALQLIDMDVTQFDQVVINLVLNARDAMPAGGVIVVRTGVDGNSASRETVHIVVEDSGDGIAADVLPHIFEPFFSTKGPGTGTGLGLAICDRIVRAAGGTITVKSDAGKGTRFDVAIPRATEV